MNTIENHSEDASGSDAAVDGPLFETNRTTDLAYILDFVRVKIDHYNSRKTDPRKHL